MINWALYGALCVQTYVYSYNFPDDRWYLKTLAYSVFLLETVQTALTGADIYLWFMAGFGNLERLQKSNFSPIDSPTIDGIISLIVQGFFAYRIWSLNKRALWLCVLIVVLAIVQAIGAAWGGIKAMILGSYAVVEVAQYLWLITSAVVDVLIAVAMTYLLRHSRVRDGQFSNHIMARIVRLTVESNALTASVAIVSFILYVAFPKEIYYTCPTGVIGKLYSNTLLVTFNNRIYFRDHPSSGLGGSVNRSLAYPSSIPQSGTIPLNLTQIEPLQSDTTSNASIRLESLHLALEMDPEKNIRDGLAIG